MGGVLGENPKANRSIYDEFFFLPQGILVVRLIPASLYLGVGFAWLVGTEALSLALGSQGSLVTPVQFWGLVVMVLVAILAHGCKMRTVEALDTGTYLSTHTNDLFEWSEVKDVEVRGRKVLFSIQDEDYKVKVKGEDVRVVKELLTGNSLGTGQSLPR